ncbi:aldo/keto reductase [Catellatospora citrea]|uniref:Oxidoreductase n=1 Tax=Catellatospora citrea TaxID=53366 RepID=A0A8J3NYI1_9ACTN|nr:aldo/keto reductase [Catellatospora citrea]RKE09533.1 diketogulonate reductase-like aldo/keto reductase [Catellatospora citrea]GIF97495.1 oxidoreductase [Catellatospora citrea]
MIVPDVTLNNGVLMPQLGFGVWQVDDDAAEHAVTTALEAGYRSIDTAKIYGNEQGVGRALRASGLPREQLFVTTKLWNTEHQYDKTLRAFDDSLASLGLDYLDLYLMHWPVPSQDLYTEAWRAMEKLYADKRVRAIGVSNFTVQTMSRLLDEFDVVPAVNQIELHPHFPQEELRKLHAVHDIATEAWSPLGQGKGLLDDPVLARVAAKHGKSPAQVVLRWHLQLGNVVIPKSVTPSRIAENIAVFDFALDDEDMAAIATLDNGGRIGPDPAVFAWMG